MELISRADREVNRAGESIGLHLAQWRKLQHLTQSQVAAAAKVSRSTVIRLERGDTGVSLNAVLKIARAVRALDAVERGFDPAFNEFGRTLIDLRLESRK